MRVVIAGQSKSGTTALYSLFRVLLPGHQYLFEPRAYQGDEQDIIIKGIVGISSFEGMAHFDTKFLIVRDPRDNLVSRFLYAPYDWPAAMRKERALGAFLTCLEAKRAEPDRISLVEMIPPAVLVEWLGLHRAALDWHDAHPAYTVIRYADALPAIVGIDPGRFGRVARRKETGSWRDWFTARDVEQLRPVYQSYMNRYGFGDDWELPAEQHIKAEYSTEYVKRLCHERAIGK